MQKHLFTVTCVRRSIEQKFLAPFPHVFLTEIAYQYILQTYTVTEHLGQSHALFPPGQHVLNSLVCRCSGGSFQAQALKPAGTPGEAKNRVLVRSEPVRPEFVVYQGVMDGEAEKVGLENTWTFLRRLWKKGKERRKRQKFLQWIMMELTGTLGLGWSTDVLRAEDLWCHP